MTVSILVSAAGFVWIFACVCLLWSFFEQQRDPLRRRLLASVSSTSSQKSTMDLSASVNSWIQAGFEAATRLVRIAPQPHTPGFRTPGQKASLIVLLAFSAIVTGWAIFTMGANYDWKLPNTMILVMIAGWLSVWLVARRWMAWHLRRWEDEIQSSLIDVLDLWVLCLGAGMGFQSALARVAQDAELAGPALREELQLTNQEMLAGCPRDEALRHLVRRCGNSSDIKGLISHVIQAERLGSSLASTMRVYADSLRFKRRENTKELIQKLPVKLAFPLTFCILPSLFVVILGPSCLRIFSVLSNR